MDSSPPPLSTKRWADNAWVTGFGASESPRFVNRGMIGTVEGGYTGPDEDERLSWVFSMMIVDPTDEISYQESSSDCRMETDL
ncbi:uncharacterized protein TERG_03053 [Trichophyton rubrum CBS 118892]|uniref:Uncharacterized protein n=1 Tax=Trichophyton rubrum (strain ATCC MYA-4607 / CBS 118892) TaxID=559305 RepID=F2SME4_TRIRC|nr:uncharacterized protein TERG_03053 [Trichophyton rubrum CBS 118892]EGD86796.2 hypothetical protein TERG_03053 [Trichophyton rubrum CBS 118892]